MKPVIEFENVTIGYEDRILFKNLSFTVYEQEVLLIKGPSGTGKTTILYTIMGLLKPVEGKVRICGKKLSLKNLPYIRRKISYVPQNPDILRENTEKAIEEILEREKKFERKKLKELIDFFQLPEETLQKDFSELSGGEKQRILLITAILLDRDIFLLDEPTSALDEDLKVKVADFIGKLGKTTVVISHDREWESVNNIRVMEVNNGGS